jgi:hypothetical protein
MADQDRTRSWPTNVCHGCGGERGSRRVVTTDELGAPTCLPCRSRQLGGIDGAQSASFDLLERLAAAIVGEGLLSPVDADLAWRDAVSHGVARRRRTNMRPTPTMAELQEQIKALDAIGRGQER